VLGRERVGGGGCVVGYLDTWGVSFLVFRGGRGFFGEMTAALHHYNLGIGGILYVVKGVFTAK